MLGITPEDIQITKERIQMLRDKAYQYFLKNVKKTDRIPHRWNREITDKQAIRYIHKVHWYHYVHLRKQGRNTSSDHVDKVVDFYQKNDLNKYFSEEEKQPRLTSSGYYLMNRDNILQQRKLRYYGKKENMNLSSMNNMSDRLLNEFKTGYGQFEIIYRKIS